mmetsp:Transcript_31453/g.48113  ORF Transcript_31453/g.48113 Transcript_31453/m.48113 type:complete len:183 (-) Transcript_31453:204-752(-)
MQKEDLPLISTENMHPDFYSGTFYSLRKDVKKKFRLLRRDQSDYYFESLFILAVQLLLCVSIIVSGGFNFPFVNDYALNLCLFFSCLVLHFSTLSCIRNGINMCKFVVYHPENFENPAGVFFLGFLIVCINILCAATNMMQSLTLTKPQDVIAKFVGFKLLIQVQDYYMRQRANFEVKKAVN